MKMTKKALALIMAVVMLASVFMFSASALTYSPSLTTGEVGLILTADKTTVNPGDVVTFSICVDRGSKDDFGPWMTTIVYNGAQIAPTSTTNTEFRQYVNECANFMKQSSTVNFAYPIAQLTALTTEEKAYYTKAIMMNGVADTSLTDGKAGNGWTPADSATPQCVFTMKVAADVTPGTEIWVGNHEATYTKGVSYMGPAGGTRFAKTVYNLTNSMVKLTVASAGPVVAKSKAQVKMTPNSADTVEDAFSFRVTSVIADADWDTYFANSAEASATTNAIKSVGFVAYKGTTGFNLDTAKAVAQGTPAAGYDVATTDYIQKVSDTSDAYFGCRLEITSAAARSDVTYVAFVQYLDASGNTAYAFYDAEQTALLNTNYDTIVSNYLATYPYAG